MSVHQKLILTGVVVLIVVALFAGVQIGRVLDRAFWVPLIDEMPTTN